MSDFQRLTPDQKLARKNQALAYYQENGVPKVLEDLLNTMYYEQPNDIYGYMSSFFGAYAKIPTFEKVKGGAMLDGRGFPSLRVLVYYVMREKKQVISEASVGIPTTSRLPVVLDKGDELDTEAALFVNDNVQVVLSGLGSTQDQLSIDALLGNVDPHPPKPMAEAVSLVDEGPSATSGGSAVTLDQRKKSSVGSSASPSGRKASKTTVKKEEEQTVKPFATKSEIQLGDVSSVTSSILNEPPPYISRTTFCVSAAICKAVAKINHIPLHTHINNAFNQMRQCPSRKITLPNFMVTMIANTRLRSPTRLNMFSEAGIITNVSISPLIAEKVLGVLYRLNHAATDYMNKFGVMSCFQLGDQGCPILPIEHFDQVLEILNSAMTATDIKSGNEVASYFIFTPAECYDEEKAKYEYVRGQQKHSDEMLDWYADLVKKVPSVAYLVDPFITEDLNSWTKLAGRLEEFSNCHLGLTVSNIAKMKGDVEEKRFRDLPFSAAIITSDVMATVSEAFSAVDFIRRLKPTAKIIIAVPDVDTSEDFMVDLSIGVQASYLKLGGLMRGERVAKLNRFMNICEEMSDAIYEWALK